MPNARTGGGLQLPGSSAPTHTHPTDPSQSMLRDEAPAPIFRRACHLIQGELPCYHRVVSVCLDGVVVCVRRYPAPACCLNALMGPWQPARGPNRRRGLGDRTLPAEEGAMAPRRG